MRAPQLLCIPQRSHLNALAIGRYYRVFKDIRAVLPKDAIIVSAGRVAARFGGWSCLTTAASGHMTLGARDLPCWRWQVSEGANTMDIGRTLMLNYLPRHRLDAGTFGTMGVGLGFAIAAAVAFPDKQVVSVEGDSAFGFSGMELEAAVRHRLANLTVLVVNNNGIYQGLEELDDEPEW